jgi:phage terminase large subunit
MTESSQGKSSLPPQMPKGVSSYLRKKARYKAFWGGRAGTKSWTFASQLLLLGVEKPLRILCCREIQNSIRDSVKRLLEDRIEAMGLQSYYTWTDSEIRGHNGTLFIFKGLWRNPETVKSLEGADIVWIEEAQAISQASLRTLTPTVRKPGSEIWFSWNPRNRDDPVDVMFVGRQHLSDRMS